MRRDQRALTVVPQAANEAPHPSQRSLRGLDWFIFFVADIQTGFGPFVAIYLNDPAVTREVHRRTELCVPVLPVRMPFSSNDDEDVQAQAHALAQCGAGRVPA